MLTDFNVPNMVARLRGITIQSDGKIVAVGDVEWHDSTSDLSYAAMARYNANGTLDEGFGNAGLVVSASEDDPSYQAVTVQADGKIVVVGHGGLPFRMLRYTSDGVLDSSFGDGGVATADFGWSWFDNLVVQADGKIIILENVWDDASNVSGVAMARFNTDGTLDSGFGDGGKVISCFDGDPFCPGLGAAIRSDGRIVVTGSVGVDDGDALIAQAFYTPGQTVTVNPLNLTWDPDGVNDSHFGSVTGQTDDWTKTDAWVDTETGQRYTWNGATTAYNEAIFLGDGGTVNLPSGVTVDSLVFQSAGYTLTGSGAVTLTGDTAIVAAESATINMPVNLGTDQQWTVASGKTLSVTGNVDLGGHGLTVQGSGAATLSGAVSGSGGSLVKTGAGTLTLGQTNTYTGGTTIDAGTVAFANNAFGTSGTIAFAGNATLQWSSGNTQDLSGRLVIANGVTATVDVGSNNVTFATGFGGSGSGGLTKAGSGLLTLSAANTYSGGTTLNAGTVAFAGNALGTSGSITFAGNATLQWASGNGQDISSRLVMANGTNATFDLANSTTFATAFGNNSTASITKAGVGILTLNAANSYRGGTTLNAGTVAFLAGGLGTTGTVTINGGTLQWNDGNTEDISSRLVIDNAYANINISSGTATFASAIGHNGSGTVSKRGNGTLILLGSNNYGNTDIFSGTLQVGNGGTTGTLGVGAVAQGSGRLVFNRSDYVTVDNQIRQGMQVVQQGSGTLNLTNTNNDYSGGTTINAGIVAFASGSSGKTSLGTTGAITFAGNATLQWGANNAQDLSGRLVINNGVNATLDIGTNAVTFASSFGAGGSGSLTKAGTGTLTLSGADTYTGTTKIVNGTLKLADGNPLASSTLDYNTYGGSLSFGSLTSAAFGGLEGSQNLSLTNDSSQDVALTIGGNDANTTYDGVLSGGSGVTKTGSGVLTLTGANTYTGGMTIHSGTLAFASGGLGTLGTVAFGGDSTLRWFGANTQDLSGRLVIGSGVHATIDVGANDVTFATAVSGSSSGSLVKAGSGTLSLAVVDAYAGGLTINAGTLAFVSAPWMTPASLPSLLTPRCDGLGPTPTICPTI